MIQLMQTLFFYSQTVESDTFFYNEIFMCVIDAMLHHLLIADNFCSHH